ncbi:hypothetical protein PoB_002263200 [Plakobranchus ocellatus]|uniref:Uncharacterized protein n=1 Tax=Plakobranchus ocellatus TaxID=259542 RepID=A0AAV3ZNM8_9GAST|nr:hypothetical protein PoB_002263200 [Plakobranchus ocellatus]
MPERSPPVQNQNLSLSHVTDLSHEQANDSSLQSWFSAVGRPPVRGVSFVVENGILFREFRSPSFYKKTLVVPLSWRREVLSAAHDSPYLVIRDFGRHWLMFKANLVGRA